MDQVITPQYALYHGDCMAVMDGLPDESVHLSVYSPPFGGLYTYSSDERDLSNALDYTEFLNHYEFVVRGLHRLTLPGRMSAVHCMDIPTGNTGLDHLRDFPGDVIHAAHALRHRATRPGALRVRGVRTRARLRVLQHGGVCVNLLYAVDPGTVQSALVVVEQTPRGTLVREHHTALNAIILAKLHCAPLGAELVIEQIEAMGMAVGHETFETVFWSGRFYETWPNESRYRLPRRPIKLHLCGSMQAKDANIRQALLDRFGGSRESAIGTIKKQGPLYGVKGHEFAALAVAVTWLETLAQKTMTCIEPPLLAVVK